MRHIIQQIYIRIISWMILKTIDKAITVVRKENKYNYIDKTGQLLLPLENASCDNSRSKKGHTVVKKMENTGWNSRCTHGI